MVTKGVTFAVVVIGRNEGERLVRCLASLNGAFQTVVYVDSGSEDQSVDNAKEAGAQVVQLDMSVPFTAARARNAGFEFLQQQKSLPDYVQFIDGDCELTEGWLDTAAAFLDEMPDVASVCGRLSERFPDANIYTRLAQAEWDRPVGETDATGGIFLVRASAFAEVDGFDPELAAGEEPDFCFRLRRAGWRIWRLADQMALHDIAMTRFSQWWKRTKRAGFTYAEGVARYGGTAEKYNVKELRRAIIWGLGIPLIVCLGLVVSPLFWPLLIAWPLQVLRLTFRLGSWERGLFSVAGKLPEALGAFSFWASRAK